MEETRLKAQKIVEIKAVNEQNYLDKLQRKNEQEAEIRQKQLANAQEKVSAQKRREIVRKQVAEKRRQEYSLTKQSKEEGKKELMNQRVEDLAQKMV